eukprot:Gb_00604 [translate_table: standard]
MATVQNLQHSGLSTASSFPSGSPDGFSENGGFPNQFPAGLRVLVVDDDPICLKIIDKMLRRCLYEVTTCCQATVALSMLRERKGGFDLVLSDVYMPDMDGFKLLEHVGLEMDLPVIMMSADGETRVVMKGIKHGACDYLLKPVRMEELKNIWQHVIRKKRNGGRELEHSGSVDSDRHKKGSDDIEYASSVNEGMDGNWKTSKRRKEAKEEDDDFEQENDDPSSLKKPRVVWSVELHQQFVSAVNQLGIDKAVPKRILEMMNVQGLTRENVASHLQKYRLYLRRLSGVAQQQDGINTSFGGTTEINFDSIGSLGRLDLQALASSGQISPSTLMAWQAGLLGRVNANNCLRIPGETPLLQAALQSKYSNSSNSLSFVKPLLNSQGNSVHGLPNGFQLKQFTQPQPHDPSYGNVGFSMNDISSGLSLLQQQQPATAAMGLGDLEQLCVVDKNVALNAHNNVLMKQLIQQQQQKQQWQQLHPQMQTPVELLHQPSAQFQGRKVQNLPLASRLAQQVLSNPLSTLGINSQGNSVGACSSQVNHIPALEHASTLLASNAHPEIKQMSAVDYKNHSLRSMTGNSFCLPTSVGASAPLSIGIEGAMCLPGVKSLCGGPEIVNFQTSRDSGSNSSGLGLSISPSNIQGWQALHFALNQDLSQMVNPVLSPRYSQASSGNQGLNVPGIQDHVQVKTLGCVGKGSCLPNAFALDDGCPRTVGNAPCQSDQSTADSGPSLKGDVSDIMEGARLAKGEFSTDCYQLNNARAI